MNDLLRNVERRTYLRSQGANPDVIEAYDDIISDLRQDIMRANTYDDYFSGVFLNVVNTDNENNAVSTSEDNKNTDSQYKSQTDRINI